MHRKSALKSARMRLFRANCRSDRQLDSEAAPSPPTGGRPTVSALVAEREAFDDLNLPIADWRVVGRAAAPQVGAIVAMARAIARESAQCR
jgi:hypothetical protein